MSRYIDADKLKEKLDSFILTNETPTNYNCGYDDCLTAVLDTLADTPTADVVSVVRCKDCRLAVEDIMIEGCYLCYDNGMIHQPDDFCSYGERKDEK